MAGVTEQYSRHFLGTQDVVCIPDLDQVTRHARELSRVRILSDAKTTDCFNGLGTGRAIRAHAAHHHTDPTFTLLFCQAFEEVIDGTIRGSPASELRAESKLPLE